MSDEARVPVQGYLGRETIIAAAIRTDHGVRSLPPPARHHTLAQAELLEYGPIPKGVSELDCQGFLTSERRFVDRREAAAIALSAGQVTELQWPPDLYSEDLW